MTTAPFASVIIPTHDRWPLVADAVTSVLALTGPSFEVIVVDDGSVDGTVEELAAMSLPIRVIRQDNRGRSAARNAGVGAARGEMLCFLDSDDLYQPWHLAQAVAAGATSGGLGRLWSAPIELWEPASDRTWRPPPSRWLPKDLRIAALLGTVLPLPGWIVPTWAVRRVGGFPEGLPGSEDWILLVRLTRLLGVVALERPSVLVRDHPGRSMSDARWDIEWRRTAGALLLAEADAVGLDGDERAIIDAGCQRYVAARSYEVGDVVAARAALREVRRRVGPRRGWRWTARLWLQTWIGPGALAWLRRR